jgi:flavin reductase (DIM6/NTAB) family NADH-FMN oxidoreductase RutF
MLSKVNHTFPVAQQTDHLAVHFLHPDNCELARLFGEQSGDHVDKFESCDWHEGPKTLPILNGTRGWVVGQVITRFDCGDHVAHLLEVINAAAPAADGQLGFQAIRSMTPGHPA